MDTRELYRMRLSSDWGYGELGTAAQVEVDGRRYAIVGKAKRFRGSIRTSHDDYTLLRR